MDARDGYTLAQELESLEHIYSGNLQSSFAASGSVDSCDHTFVTVVISRAAGDIAVSFDVPAEYPVRAPACSIEGAAKGASSQALVRIHKLLNENLGEPMIFLAVEAARDFFGDDFTGGVEADVAHALPSAPAVISAAAAARGIKIMHGDPLVVNKSTFQAHVARVYTVEDVAAVLQELYEDSKIAKATHNIRAFRLVAEHSKAVIADNDDDGEDAAGGRLGHLLELMKVENAVVIVTRHFGGVLLGPARFKYINDRARDILEQQPWYQGRGKRS